MSRIKRKKKMKGLIGNSVLETIPEDKSDDLEFLTDVLVYRNKYLNEGRNARKRLESKFNKEHGTKGVKVLRKWSKKHGDTVLTAGNKKNLKRDKNLIKSLMTIVHNKFPRLIHLFEIIPDKRQKGKIKYSMKTIVLVRLLALVCGIVSMNEMNEKFNKC